MRLRDKVALVTGGGSGIGGATAVLFAAQGAKVVVSDLNEANALETVAEIKIAEGDATALTGDVSKNTDAEAMVKGTVETYGTLDVVVNCAGVIAGKALPEGASPEEVWGPCDGREPEGDLFGNVACGADDGAIRRRFDNQHRFHQWNSGLSDWSRRRIRRVCSLEGRCGSVHEKFGDRLRQEEHPRELHLSGSHRHQSNPGVSRQPRTTGVVGAALPDGSNRSPRRDCLRGTVSGIG